jgi:hypothetical protein
MGWAERRGALFVLNCAGERLATLNLGQVLRLGRGPTLPDVGPTLVVVYVYVSGMGQNGSWVQLVTFQSGSIVTLWDHEHQTAVDAPGLAEYGDFYTWEFSDDGSTIWVRGRREVGDIPDDEYGWDANTTHEFPSQAWSWQQNSGRYVGFVNLPPQ